MLWVLAKKRNFDWLVPLIRDEMLRTAVGKTKLLTDSQNFSLCDKALEGTIHALVIHAPIVFHCTILLDNTCVMNKKIAFFV